MIHKDMSMGKAALENERLLPLLARFRIPLGFGDETVEEVCRKHGIHVDFFLEMASIYMEEALSPLEDLSTFSLKSVVYYLRSTHSYYTELALPQIEEKILRLLEDPVLSDKEKNLVAGFFDDYKQEFMSHISEEELDILPYILELDAQYARPDADEAFLDKLKDYSISKYAQEHERLEISLQNLRKLIILYLPPFRDQKLCLEVLYDLDDLVRDLADHADMEDRVLIPRVCKLEKELLQRHQAG